jgi:hypothetical protein
MPNNKAIIPLYLNTDMLNNLFTIVIQQFVEIKSIATRDIITIHLKTPVSELSYDLFGKFMQGELDVTIQNEFAKQRTEERVSTTIVIFMKLRDILSSQGILKSFTSGENTRDLEVNDYVEFPCKLSRNPNIENLLNTINMLEIQNAMGTKQDEVTVDTTLSSNNVNYLLKRKELLDYLKASYTNHKQERCIKYIANNSDSNISAVVPIKMGSLLDHEDYMLTGNVTVLGKVVKKVEENVESSMDGLNDFYENLISNDAFFDNIDYEQLHNINCPFLRRIPRPRRISGDEKFHPKYEILPIAIYT